MSTSPTPYESLLQDCQTLSMEAFSLNDLKRAIDNTVPRISSTFMDALRFMTRWDYSQPETLGVNALRLKARRLDYLEMDSIHVPVPVGFHGSLADYSTHLQTAILPALASVPAVLDQAIDFVGRYINEPELFHERDLVQVELMDRQHLDVLLKQESDFFIAGNRVSDLPYTQVFENNAGMVETATKVNLINQKYWAVANPKTVSQKIKTLGQSATVLMKSIQEMQTPPHKEHLRNVADTLELTARWVEWYSATLTRLTELTASMKRMEKKLIRI